MLIARPAPGRAQLRRQDLHEPGQDDRVRVVLLDQVAQLGERLLPGDLARPVARRRELDVVERHVVGPHDPGERLVVADHRGQLDGELVGGHPTEQVVQAVRLLRDQEHGPLADPRVRDRPVRLPAERGGDRRELVPQLVHPERQRVGPHRLAGEEPAGGRVGVVARLDDPAAGLGEKAGDPSDDPGGVGAGQRDDVAAVVLGAHPSILPGAAGLTSAGRAIPA